MVILHKMVKKRRFKINTSPPHKSAFAYTADQVFQSLGAALDTLELNYEFDVNKAPEVLYADRGVGLTLRDACGNPITALRRNVVRCDRLVIAPLSLMTTHWSLMIYYNGVIYAYHTNDHLSRRDRCLQAAGEQLFGRLPIRILTCSQHQDDDFACGAYIIAAAVIIGKALVTNQEPSLAFSKEEVSWVLATRVWDSPGEPAEDTVEVPYITTIRGDLYYCPLCPRAEDPKGVSKQILAAHLFMAHSVQNAAGLNMMKATRNKEAHLRGLGLEGLEAKMGWVVRGVF